MDQVLDQNNQLWRLIVQQRSEITMLREKLFLPDMCNQETQSGDLPRVNMDAETNTETTLGDDIESIDHQSQSSRFEGSVEADRAMESVEAVYQSPADLTTASILDSQTQRDMPVLEEMVESDGFTSDVSNRCVTEKHALEHQHPRAEPIVAGYATKESDMLAPFLELEFFKEPSADHFLNLKFVHETKGNSLSDGGNERSLRTDPSQLSTHEIESIIVNDSSSNMSSGSFSQSEAIFEQKQPSEDSTSNDGSVAGTFHGLHSSHRDPSFNLSITHHNSSDSLQTAHDLQVVPSEDVTSNLNGDANVEPPTTIERLNHPTNSNLNQKETERMLNHELPQLPRNVPAPTALPPSPPQQSQNAKLPSRNSDTVLDKLSQLMRCHSLSIEVLSSSTRDDNDKKAVTFYEILVHPTPFPEFTVEKQFLDFQRLHEQLPKNTSIKPLEKRKYFSDRRRSNTISPLVWTTYRTAIARYLLSFPLHQQLFEFLSVDVVSFPLRNKTSFESFQEGYLSKKGKHLGKWKRRYFCLLENEILYYESHERVNSPDVLGAIALHGATIATQKTEPNSSIPFRHALMISESNARRHILCAENDQERDSWVTLIAHRIENLRFDAERIQMMQKLNGTSHSARTQGLRKPSLAAETHLAVPSRVLGTPLAHSVAYSASPISNLPSIVFRCLEYLEMREAWLEEGLYRMSGSTTAINHLRDRFEFEGDVPLVHILPLSTDVHIIASLLKLFLRSIPHPIIETYSETSIDSETIVRSIQELLRSIPIENATLLHHLIKHLVKVVSFANVNLMTLRNIGIVFCPTLNIPTKAFTAMMSNYEAIFENGSGGPISTPLLTHPIFDLATSENSSHSATELNVNTGKGDDLDFVSDQRTNVGENVISHHSQSKSFRRESAVMSFYDSYIQEDEPIHADDINQENAVPNSLEPSRHTQFPPPTHLNRIYEDETLELPRASHHSEILPNETSIPWKKNRLSSNPLGL